MERDNELVSEGQKALEELISDLAYYNHEAEYGGLSIWEEKKWEHIKKIKNWYKDIISVIENAFKRLDELEQLVKKSALFINKEELSENQQKILKSLRNEPIPLTPLTDTKNEERQALEIIKRKPVVALIDFRYTYEEWCKVVDKEYANQLPKEDFNLLKKYLG